MNKTDFQTLVQAAGQATYFKLREDFIDHAQDSLEEQGLDLDTTRLNWSDIMYVCSTFLAKLFKPDETEHYDALVKKVNDDVSLHCHLQTIPFGAAERVEVEQVIGYVSAHAITALCQRAPQVQPDWTLAELAKAMRVTAMDDIL